MDIGKSFTFVFEDQKKIEKILIGGLVMLIPVIGAIILLGYSVRLVRNVRNHHPEPLPEWDDWGGMLSEGLKLFIIYFLWSLPLIILSIFLIIPMALAGDPEDAGVIASLFGLCFSCFAFLYAIILWLAIPAITVKFAENGEISDGFEFGEIMGFAKKHVGEIIIVALVSMAAFTIAGMVGSILCVIGSLFTYFWATMVQYHLIAQIGLDEAAPRDAFAAPDSLDELTAVEEDDSLLDDLE